MANYYFLAISLPPLSLDTTPEITFEQFKVLLRDNLSEKDYRKTVMIRRLYDILNLKALWKDEEIDPHGELNANELKEAEISQHGLPEYVYDFMKKYPHTPERLAHFHSLIVTFTKEAIDQATGFLRDYLEFERELRLVFVGFRAKKLGRDLSRELQYENPGDDLIAQMLAQKDAKAYEPPEKYHDLKVFFEKYGDDPLALERALDQYRMDFIENQVEMDMFSINRIIAYMIELIIVEKWNQMDQEKGIEIINQVVKGTS